MHPTWRNDLRPRNNNHHHCAHEKGLAKGTLTEDPNKGFD